MEAKLLKFYDNALAKYPNNIALVTDDETLTYNALDLLVNQLANQMQAAGVVSQDVVALLLQDQVIQIAALIAVLKLNATYLPIFYETPKGRINTMLDIAACKTVLTDCDLESSSTIQVLRTTNYHNYSTKFTSEIDNQSAPAYIIFTSGSTGEPKGVLMGQIGPVNTVNCMDDLYPLTENDAIIQNASISFDPSVWLIFWPLAHGAKIILPNNTTDIEQLCDLVDQHQIKVLHTGPALFSGLIQFKRFSTLDSLRLIIGGGQAWQLNQLKMLSTTLPKCDFCNVYGPTEASIHATYWKISAQQLQNIDHVSIGKPIRNMQAYVLNQKLEPVGPGKIGELYLAGIGLAEGYVNQPTLTEAVFVKTNRFGRLYKTGDLATIAKDGNIDFIGRADDQVQIRGYRVELSEVSKVLNEIPGIKEGVVVVDNQEPENLKLRAFILSDVNEDITQRVKQCFQEKLPQYMCPSSVTMVSNFPLTENAKLDKKALLKQFYDHSSIEIINVDSVDQVIKNVWQKVLKKVVNENEHFFESGGDSLDALKLVAHLNSDLSIALSVMDIFEHPSLSSLINHIKQIQQQSEIAESIDISNHKMSHFPLSDNQNWLLAMAKSSKSINNIVLPLKINDKININTLQNAIINLVKKHEILRSNLNKADFGNLYIREETGDVFSVEDFSCLSECAQNREIKQRYDALNNKPIDLYNDLLFTTHLFILSNNKFRMMIFMHHIISDPASVDIILKDLTHLYRQVNLLDDDLIATPFHEYVAREQTKHNLPQYVENTKRVAARLTHVQRWVNYGEIQHNDRQSVFSQIDMPIKLVNVINDYVREEEETLFIVFLTVFAKTLKSLYKQSNFAIGVNISRRNLNIYSNMIGPLSEQAAIVFDQTQWSSDSLIKNNIKAHLQALFTDCSPSLWQIYTTLKKDKVVESADEIFNTLFDYQPMPNQNESEGILFEPLAVEPSSEIRRHLTMRISKTKSGFEFQVRYRKSLFCQENINMIVENMMNLLSELSTTELMN